MLMHGKLTLSRGPLRGFEDEKFCYVAFRRGTRPRETWPLDGMKFDTLKERHAKRIPEDSETHVESQFETEEDYDDSVLSETDASTENDNPEEEEDKNNDDDDEKDLHADLGSGYTCLLGGAKESKSMCVEPPIVDPFGETCGLLGVEKLPNFTCNLNK